MSRESVTQWPKGRGQNEERENSEQKNPLKSGGSEEMESLKKSLKESIDEISKNMGSAFQKLGEQLRDYGEAGTEKISKSVEGNPLKAVGIAAAVGFVLAYLMCGRGK